ncbi:MAG: beta-galactosidase [Planctomycetota bacterium]|nr:beta-galactosidase [Planctomycetota bacterium]
MPALSRDREGAVPGPLANARGSERGRRYNKELAMPEQTRARPHWISNTGLISVSLPEPPLARKYRGGQPGDMETRYERALADEALDALVRAGVTLVWLRFYSGFGLEFEKAESERGREFIARAHARGLKVAASVQLGLLVPETLWLEESECHNWLQVNPDGQHPWAGPDAGPAGVRPCYNSEGFLRYMERVCGLAVDCGADLVHLGNVGYNPEPDTCRCPICVGAFRDFLHQQYGSQEEQTREAGMARFGHTTFTHVRPPGVLHGARPVPDAAVDSPHEQEWIRFKVHTLTACLARLSRAIGRRNPQCTVSADLLRHADVWTEALSGVCYAEQLPHVDLIAPSPAWRQGAFTADTQSSQRMTLEDFPEGLLEEPPQPPRVSRETCRIVPGLKAARAFGVAAETDVRDGDLEINLACNLAFNPFGLGRLGNSDDPWVAPGGEERAAQDEHAKTLRAYVEFYKQHQALLLGGQSLRGIAVYHDAPSCMYDGAAGGEARRICEESLVGGWPFEPLYPNQPGEMARYRCVLLAGCEHLADGVVETLTRYVEGGGGLVAIGDAGTRDEWGRVRAVPALAGLLGPEYPQAVRRAVGAGRVAYVPQAADVEGALGALQFAAGEPAPWRVETESGRVISQAARAKSGALVLHLINVDAEPVRDVRCALACERQPQEVQPLAPGQAFEPLAFTWESGVARFTVGELARYALVQVTIQ